MAATPKSATIIHRCQIAPPPDTAEQIFPLTFFDIPWLHFHPIHRLLFYKFPCSHTHFMEKIIPSFKNSLSQTLKHFLPLSGNLIYPLDSEKLPEIRYLPGDSVSLAIAESNEAHDFNQLIGDHPREADEFYAFFTRLPPPRNESGGNVIPLLAVQITLFPGDGICVGFNNNHTVGDASSIVGFIKAWSLRCKHGFSAPDPVHDRSLVSDTRGLKDVFWEQMKRLVIESPPLDFPTNKVRTTFVLQQNDIEKLKNVVRAHNPNPNPSTTRLTSFTVAAAYVWSCLARSAAAAGEEVSGDEAEYCGFAVDARGRTEPPVPAGYFGNCVGLAVAEATHAELSGGGGFPVAVGLIGAAIEEKVSDREGFMRGAEGWVTRFGGMIGKRLFGVAGSPRFDLYEADFGWGTAAKYEAVSIDGDGSMSLCKSRELEGGLEIGLSLSKKKMDAFAGVFYVGLQI